MQTFGLDVIFPLISLQNKETGSKFNVASVPEVAPCLSYVQNGTR